MLDLKLPAALRKRCPHLPTVLTVRVLEYQIRGYRVSWLITSLIDAQAYPYAEVVHVYHQRWNQETIHREWKYTLQLSNLRSHTPQGILKEVFVQLTLNNAIRAMQAEALPFDGKPITLQFLDTKRLVVRHISFWGLRRFFWPCPSLRNLNKTLALSAVARLGPGQKPSPPPPKAIVTNH